MRVVCYTINHGNNHLEDFYSIHETQEQALAAYAVALELDNLHCACVAGIVEATEPHWVGEKQ